MCSTTLTSWSAKPGQDMRDSAVITSNIINVGTNCGLPGVFACGRIGSR